MDAPDGGQIFVVGMPIPADHDQRITVGTLVAVFDWRAIRRRLKNLKALGREQDEDHAYLLLSTQREVRVLYSSKLLNETLAVSWFRSLGPELGVRTITLDDREFVVAGSTSATDQYP